MVRITSDVNWTPGRANKVLGAGVKTSYVHSSKINEVVTGLVLLAWQSNPITRALLRLERTMNV